MGAHWTSPIVLKESCMMGGSLMPTALLLLFVGVLAVDADVKRVYWDVVENSCTQPDITQSTVECSVTPSTKPSITDDFPFYHASTNGNLVHTAPNKVMVFSSHSKDVIGAHLIENSDDWDKTTGGYFYDLESGRDSLNIIMMDYYLSKRVGKAIGDDRSFFGQGHGVDYLGSFMGDFVFKRQPGGVPIDHHGWYNEWDQDESVFAVEYEGKTMVDFEVPPFNFKPLDTVIPFVVVHCHDLTDPGCTDDLDLYMTGFEEDKGSKTTAKSVALRWLESTGQQPQMDFTFTVQYFDIDGNADPTEEFKEQRPLSLARAGPPRDHAVQEGTSPCANRDHDEL